MRELRANLVPRAGLGRIFIGRLKGGDVMERGEVAGERYRTGWGNCQPGSAAAVDSSFFDLEIAGSFECGEVLGKRRLGYVEDVLQVLEIDSLYTGEGGHDGESHRCVSDVVQPVSGMRRCHRCVAGSGSSAATARGTAPIIAAPTQNRIAPD